MHLHKVPGPRLNKDSIRPDMVVILWYKHLARSKWQAGRDPRYCYTQGTATKVGQLSEG